MDLVFASTTGPLDKVQGTSGGWWDTSKLYVEAIFDRDTISLWDNKTKLYSHLCLLLCFHETTRE